MFFVNKQVNIFENTSNLIKDEIVFSTLLPTSSDCEHCQTKRRAQEKVHSPSGGKNIPIAVKNDDLHHQNINSDP